jgi:Ca2+/Na+ antiporter
MKLSKPAKTMSALTLISLPAVIVIGFVLLSVVTNGALGQQFNLNQAQQTLWQAGYAHAIVLSVMALLLNMFLDNANLKETIKWVSRVLFQLSTLLVTISLFGLAYAEGFKWSMYLGIVTLIVSLMILAVGLLLPEKVANKTVVIKAVSKKAVKKPVKKANKRK